MHVHIKYSYPKLEDSSMLSLLVWFIVVVLVVLWVLSFLVAHLGGILHLLLILALILILVNLSRRNRGRPRVYRRG